MSKIILHHNGVYNIYTTTADGACWEPGLTRSELEAKVKKEWGEAGLKELPARLERAHATGSSAFDETLADTILCNRAGGNETELSLEEFIERYLTR